MVIEVGTETMIFLAISNWIETVLGSLLTVSVFNYSICSSPSTPLKLN